jgi:ankyrin repeat protein
MVSGTAFPANFRCFVERVCDVGEPASSKEAEALLAETPELGVLALQWLLDWRFRPEAVEWLLVRGADPNACRGPLAESALHVACRRRRCDGLELLLRHGARIDARTAGGKTAYAHAARRGFDDVVRLLTGHGADSALTRADELAVALARGELAEAHGLLRSDPGLVARFGPEDARILPDLAGRTAVEPVELLLDAGCDIVARGLDDGTSLHQAAWFGQPDQARLLIRRGAPLDIRGDAHDSPPLGWVAHGSRYSGGAEQRGEAYARVAELLLDAGASTANPHDPAGDPHGRWLLEDASAPVAAVLRARGGGDLK